MNPKRQQKLTEIVKRIVAEFNPEKIILFGSRARGKAKPESDIDLLIVMSAKKPKRRLAVEIGVALSDIRIAKDIIVTTPEEFAWRKEIPGTIERPAYLEGKVLYARK